jgi:ribosomal protein L11 methyltransferase
MKYTELNVTCSSAEQREVLMAELSEIGYESFTENDEGFLAYIPEPQFDGSVLTSLTHLEKFGCSFSSAGIPEQNWNQVWESNFEAVCIGQFCRIRAPFHDSSNEVKYEILIEPKMSFGTGHHETTSMMIQLMEGLDIGGRSLLDMGCGTGVLAILAKKMGAAEVVAIDTDEWAFQNTLENIQRNNTNEISVSLGDAELLSRWINKPFDIVLANINRNILLNDIGAYASVMKKGARLLLSGFYDADQSLILESAAQFSLRLQRSLTHNAWMAIELLKD